MSSSWPIFNPDRAHRELLAIELLTQGVSESTVRQRTKLSMQDVRDLATMCAEEAAKPAPPKVVRRASERRAPFSGARRTARHPGHNRVALSAEDVHREPPEELALF